MDNPYTAPVAPPDNDVDGDDRPVYVGFWARVGAAIIDTILLGVIIWPVLTLYYGEKYWDMEDERLVKGPMDFLLSYLFPAVAVITFWFMKQGTPGKIAVKARILCAATMSTPSIGQCIGRYFAYFLSMLPLGLGILWVAIDKRKQGWHDKLAGTVVVRYKSGK